MYSARGQFFCVSCLSKILAYFLIALPPQLYLGDVFTYGYFAKQNLAASNLVKGVV